LFVVAALADSLEVGSSFQRTTWPAHVTLASNFLVNETDDRVASAVSEACADYGPLSVRFGTRALFGRDRDVDVQIVESAQILALHERLSDLLEAMRGFAATEPDYWRDGYRPHMTHVPGLSIRPGDVTQLSFIAVAKMTQSHATITSALALPSAPAD
jgi:hypothetical protein